MGDIYNVNNSQVSAVGPNAKVSRVEFKQNINNIASPAELRKLANEISTLRNSLQQNAQAMYFKPDINTLAKAEQAAKSGSGFGKDYVLSILKHLSPPVIAMARDMMLPTLAGYMKSITG